jgi:hypothetical protein
MKKNLKNSILFILMAIMILLVVVMSLAASKPVPSINTATVSTQKENNLKYGKWSGLGFCTNSQADTATFDSMADNMLGNGFTELRIDVPSYQKTAIVAQSKAAVIRAIAKGARVIWGVSSNSFEDPADVITAASWPSFRQAILDAAAWAQANGVFEFQIGNEEEYHVDGTTMTIPKIITNIKGVAAEAKAIFTRGNISYSFSYNHLSYWLSAGKGNIDLLGMNVYRTWGTVNGANDWKGKIDSFVAAFSPGYITEFSLNTQGLQYYSTDEAVQAAALTEMIDYFKSSGITRAIFFKYQSAPFGAWNWDGTYKLIWDRAIINNTEPTTTVPTTTTSV